MFSKVYCQSAFGCVLFFFPLWLKLCSSFPRFSTFPYVDNDAGIHGGKQFVISTDQKQRQRCRCSFVMCVSTLCGGDQTVALIHVYSHTPTHISRHKVCFLHLCSSHICSYNLCHPETWKREDVLLLILFLLSAISPFSSWIHDFIHSSQFTQLCF